MVIRAQAAGNVSSSRPRVIARRKAPDAAFFVGSGKADELSFFIDRVLQQGHAGVGTTHHSALERERHAHHVPTAVDLTEHAVVADADVVAALLADGWHMATDSLSLAISVFAYSYASRCSNDPRFAWGTGKVGTLAGFASALVLLAMTFIILPVVPDAAIGPAASTFRT